MFGTASIFTCICHYKSLPQKRFECTCKCEWESKWQRDRIRGISHYLPLRWGRCYSREVKMGRTRYLVALPVSYALYVESSVVCIRIYRGCTRRINFVWEWIVCTDHQICKVKSTSLTCKLLDSYTFGQVIHLWICRSPSSSLHA